MLLARLAGDRGPVRDQVAVPYAVVERATT
jgi:hypothetical protein